LADDTDVLDGDRSRDCSLAGREPERPLDDAGGAAASVDARRTWPATASRLRLLWMIGDGCRVSSTAAPARLGRGGATFGRPLAAGTVGAGWGRRDGAGVLRLRAAGFAPPSFGSLGIAVRGGGPRLEDSRRGGVGGGGAGRAFGMARATSGGSIGSAVLTVDDDEVEANDSRTADRPRRPVRSSWSGPLILRRVTGGRLRVGLSAVGRAPALGACSTAGEYDEAEVGVDVRLKGPGDSERRVEALLLRAKPGVGGERSSAERCGGGGGCRDM
jgi:hypothetical protein